MGSRTFALAAAFFVLCSCPGELQNPERFLTGGDAGPSCPDVETEIFQMRCATAGCHDATTIAQGLDLASAGVADRLRTATATCTSAAGQRMGTFLMNKVGPSPTCGGPMPLGGTTLTAAEVQCVNAYLADAGAL